MLYVKNVPAWERIIRTMTGVAALAFAVMNWGNTISVAAGLVGAIMSMTGLLGYCPMCAIAGRTLDKGA